MIKSVIIPNAMPDPGSESLSKFTKLFEQGGAAIPFIQALVIYPPVTSLPRPDLFGLETGIYRKIAINVLVSQKFIINAQNTSLY